MRKTLISANPQGANKERRVSLILHFPHYQSPVCEHPYYPINLIIISCLKTEERVRPHVV